MVYGFLSCSSFNISGQTGAGKTEFVFKLLRHTKEMFPDDPPRSILYCYGIYQPLFDEMQKVIPNITFHKGLPAMELIEKYTEDRHHKILVCDDLAHQVNSDLEMELLFTRGSHHLRLSLVLISQNAFYRAARSRTIALNTTYMILMKNVRDVSQIAILGRQLYPGKWKLLTEAYSDATSNPYGYLVVDMSPHSDDTYRLRTRVFPGEDPIVYVPKKDKRERADE